MRADVIARFKSHAATDPATKDGEATLKTSSKSGDLRIGFGFHVIDLWPKAIRGASVEKGKYKSASSAPCCGQMSTQQSKCRIKQKRRYFHA